MNEGESRPAGLISNQRLQELLELRMANPELANEIDAELACAGLITIGIEGPDAPTAVASEQEEFSVSWQRRRINGTR